MAYLIIVSFIWAFSFGLIKGNLTGLDPNFVAFARLAIAAAVFLPFLRIKGVPFGLGAKLVLIGAIQFGVMYITYIYSYRYLQAHQVALYTIFTPLYVTLIHDVLERRFHGRFLATSLLAVAGTYIIVGRDLHRLDLQKGFLILQASNLCFAFGQVAYRRVMGRHRAVKDRSVFGLLYLGAVAATLLAAMNTTSWSELTVTSTQWATLAYLGILASGLGFFLWNYGARKTNAGALAVLNNLKVPLAVACSLIFFGEAAGLGKLLVGGGIIVGALFLNEFTHRGSGARI